VGRAVGQPVRQACRHAGRGGEGRGRKLRGSTSEPWHGSHSTQGGQFQTVCGRSSSCRTAAAAAPEGPHRRLRRVANQHERQHRPGIGNHHRQHQQLQGAGTGRDRVRVRGGVGALLRLRAGGRQRRRSRSSRWRCAGQLLPETAGAALQKHVALQSSAAPALS
jgi:hypothetical protein